MTRSEINRIVAAEYERAVNKHPLFPKDKIHAAAIVCEESGELIRECLNNVYHNENNITNIKTEAIQTIVTAIRFLENLD